MNVHHRRALYVLGATVLLDVILGVLYGLDDNIGVWHGLYCATGTATTVGCDALPNDPAGYVLSVIMMLTILPLFAAVFAFFTSGLTAEHVDQANSKQTHEIKKHVDDTKAGS